MPRAERSIRSKAEFCFGPRRQLQNQVWELLSYKQLKLFNLGPDFYPFDTIKAFGGQLAANHLLFNRYLPRLGLGGLGVLGDSDNENAILDSDANALDLDIAGKGEAAA